MHLFEDLVTLGRSPKLLAAVKTGRSVVNTQNVRRGVKARRGDGTLGEIVPGETAIFDRGYAVGRGRIATVEIGVEVKVLAISTTRWRLRSKRTLSSFSNLTRAIST
jgi:hypothetical protein